MVASVTTLAKAAVIDAPSGVDGTLETRAFFNRDSQPIQTYLHHVAPFSTIRIAGASNDSCLYIWEGDVKAGNSILESGSSAVVEYGASLELTAGENGAALLNFTLKARPTESRRGGHVHLMPSAIVPNVHCMIKDATIGGSLHFIADCPTCSLWLHENDFRLAGEETLVHSHSEDEIIFVNEGEIRLGNKIFPRGTAIFVSANTKYGFYTGPNGMKTLCFRGVAPTMVDDSGGVVDETHMWTSYIGTPHYIPFPSAS